MKQFSKLAKYEENEEKVKELFWEWNLRRMVLWGVEIYD